MRKSDTMIEVDTDTCINKLNGVEGEYLHKSNSTTCRHEVRIRRTISTTVRVLTLQP